MMLEELNRINLLFDIYASLLTERQKEALQLYFSDNYSLGEIAGEYKVSRQAVYDLIQRSLNTLEKLETKLGLYQLFNRQEQLLTEADALLSAGYPNQAQLTRLRDLVNDLRLSIEQ
jgi:uncharacterized protein